MDPQNLCPNIFFSLRHQPPPYFQGSYTMGKRGRKYAQQRPSGESSTHNSAYMSDKKGGRVLLNEVQLVGRVY